MAKIYEIISASKSELKTEEELRAALAVHYAGAEVETIKENNKTWTIRLAADDEEDDSEDGPPFGKKEDGDSDSDSDSSDSDKDSDDDGDNDGDKDGDKDGDGDGGKKDHAAEVKAVIDQLTDLFQDLGGKVDQLQAAHDEKADKLKDIGDTVGEDAGPPPGMEADGGPVGPGAGPAPGIGGPGGPPKPGLPGPGPDGRKRPVPPMPGGGLPTFTNYQVAKHPGVNEQGERISLVAAAAELEKDADFTAYEVVGMTENADGTYSAKLKLKA
jgi:hypothetical protein